MKNWYCKPSSEAEAIEIVERAVANGAEACDSVKGMSIGVGRYYWDAYRNWGVMDGCTYTQSGEWNEAEQLTIQQVRELFPRPNEVKDMSDSNIEYLQMLDREKLISDQVKIDRGETTEISLLKDSAFSALSEAEKRMFEYARKLPVGKERTKAFEIYENIRTAARVY